jgi:putative nucleotidyltransferase with HDIG domain
VHTDAGATELAVFLNKSLMDVHPRELAGMVKDIPTLPVIYQQLFQLMQDPEVSIPRVSDLMAQDQALSSKILHLVNSAFYGYNKGIKTISRAVVILGFRAVRSAALAISVFDYFKDEGESGGINMKDFWVHSIAAASTCKVLAEQVKLAQHEEAFVVGLLHDVGKLIEKRYFAKDFEDLYRAAQEQHLSWYGGEQLLFQINHATIGKAVFRAWDFPSTVVDAIHYHHDPEKAGTVPQLAALVHVADFMTYQMRMGAPGAYPPVACSPAALKVLGLTEAQTFEFHEQIRSELDSSLEILKLIE